jgi:transposase
MKPPLFVRPLSDGEHATLTAGLRSADAFTVRRCHTAQRAPVLASARAETASRIAAHQGWASQTVRNAIRAFNTTGLDALVAGSRRPHRIDRAFDDDAAAERLRALLHQSPRLFGNATSVWTLDLLAAVCVAQGITRVRVTGETIRATLTRLGVRWQRAKGWITSPDPAYRRKKGGRVPSGCD